MLKNPHKILVFLNIIIITILYGDLLTNNYPFPEELDEFYKTEQKYGQSLSGLKRYEIHNYIYCKSGNKYKIGIIPDTEIKSGQSITITETKYLGKVKTIEYQEAGIKNNIHVSFLLDPYICVFAFLTLIITVVNIFRTHALYEFALTIFSVLIYMVCFVYLYYL
jgi:ribosomal protein S17